MSGSRIVVVGDVINDVIVVPRGEVRPDTDTTSTIRPRPGGSAANTAAWLGSLGAAVDFVGCVGAADAELHEQLLREQGVTPHLVVDPGLPTGTIVIIIDGDQRTMLTERGANRALRTAAVSDELLGGAAALLVSGYTILAGFSAADVRDLFDRAERAGVPRLVTFGSAGYLAEFGVPAFLALIAGAQLAFLNLDEGRLVTGESDPERIAQALLGHVERVVMTLGPDGALVAERGGSPARIPAPAVRIVDPTGAGDAFAAGFLERWITGTDAVAAAEAAAFVAARAVMVLGGRPPV